MISKPNNVIDLSGRRSQKSVRKKADLRTSVEAPVVDMTERRNEILRQERRHVKRTILTEFIGSFAVVPQKGLMRVSIYDVSDNGLAFDMQTEQGRFREGEEVALRVYLNHTSYFPFTVKIKNVRSFKDEGLYRHGSDLIKESLNAEAWRFFVKFIESVSASLQSDEGDILVSNLKE